MNPAATGNRLAWVLFVLSFLTLNLEILPVGEYQPLGFIALALLTLGKYRTLAKRPVIAAGVLAAAVLSGLVLGKSAALLDAARLLVGPFFLVFGASLFRVVPPQAYLFLIYLHFGLLVLGVVAPGLIVPILSVLYPRGASYYEGFNSFFSAEPSYAALNVFGVFCLYVAKCGLVDKNFRPPPLPTLCLTLVLLATKSVTGVAFALIIATYCLLSLLWQSGLASPFLWLVLAVLLTARTRDYRVAPIRASYNRGYPAPAKAAR